ncbi:competence/damage-inducible protein A [Egicoccus sp. AB-alg6-2]|uniref:competence/damage-inducible protein A n=1 Tax=Egicoccus sp. AB-alg6-2 TaxID=3242692 RepID=UPI00359DCBE0
MFVLEASMVVIGDEILGGHVIDANSGWFASRLTAHGVTLSRVQVVPDEHDAIDEALVAELARARPRLIVTSGGIGSTPDDITYEAVADSLGRDLVVDPVIAQRLDGALDWTRQQGVEVTDAFAEHFHRMARVPEGARLLRRSSGWVPGIAVDVDGGCTQPGGATIAILPGVPAEFRAIVTEALEPDVLAGRNPLPTIVEIEHPFPESSLNVLFAALVERFPQVRLGSYPGQRMLIRLQGTDADVRAAEAFVRAGIDDLHRSPGGARLAASWAARRSKEDS